MSAFRPCLSMARLVLAWFVLTLGVAAASPALHPQAAEWVCSGSKIVLVGEDGHKKSGLGHSTLDCPDCLPSIGPAPSLWLAPLSHSHPQGYALQPIEAARLASLLGAPLPARGPSRTHLTPIN